MLNLLLAAESPTKMNNPPTLWIVLGASVAIVAVLLFINRVPLIYTIRNITVRWLTTLLTAVAFTCVVALLVVMLAFTTGMQKMTEGTGEPGNVLLLSEGATDEGISNLNISDLGEIEQLPQVEREQGTDRPLASRETYLIVKQPVRSPKPGRPTGRFLQVRGVSDAGLAEKVHNIHMLPGGSWFSDAGSQEMPGGDAKAGTVIQAVVGEGVAQELAADRTPEEIAAAKNPKRLDVGDTFRLGARDWIVTGIMKSAGSAYSSEIWAKKTLVGPVFGKDSVTTLLLRTASAEKAQELKDFLRKDYQKATVAAFVEKEYYESLAEANKQFLFAIIFVTIVMSIGGIFGVMNTMFAAISNRIKDIGVLRLLGYARWHILVSFLLESLIIALIGGLLGCAIGSLCNGASATSVLSSGGPGGKSVVLVMVVDAHIWAAGMFLSLLMGSIGGLLPAISAVRQKPLEALR